MLGNLNCLSVKLQPPRLNETPIIKQTINFDSRTQKLYLFLINLSACTKLDPLRQEVRRAIKILNDLELMKTDLNDRLLFLEEEVVEEDII